MIGKTGWTALIAVFMAVAFLPGVFAQQTAIETGAVIEAREQAEAAASALGGLDLGALLGGGAGGLLSALGGSLGGILSGFGPIVASIVLLCGELPIVGTLFTLMLSGCLYFAAKLYGMTAGVNGIGAVILGGWGAAGFIADCLGLCSPLGLCCNLICSVPCSCVQCVEFCYGFIPEILGTIDGLCSACLTCTCVPAMVGGVATACAGFISFVSAVLAVVADICLGVVSACIAAIPGLCCTGCIEGCLAGCVAPFSPIFQPIQCCVGACMGGCFGLLNPIALAIADHIIGALGVLASCCAAIPVCCYAIPASIGGLCCLGCGDVSAIFGACEAACSVCINPCSSLCLVCDGLLNQLWSLIKEALLGLEGLVSGLCCCYACSPTWCLNGLKECAACSCCLAGTCKVPCVVL